jgi:hypothetical protein
VCDDTIFPSLHNSPIDLWNDRRRKLQEEKDSTKRALQEEYLLYYYLSTEVSSHFQTNPPHTPSRS